MHTLYLSIILVAQILHSVATTVLVITVHKLMDHTKGGTIYYTSQRLIGSKNSVK